MKKNRKLFFTFIGFLVFIFGCGQEPEIPKLLPIHKISGKVYSLPEEGILPVDLVDVPKDQTLYFSKLITPVKKCQQEIDPKINFHIADVFITHNNGTTTKIIIRWTGQHPAALSTNDAVYYYGGYDEFPDGAIRIVRLLREYKNDSFDKGGNMHK